MRLLHPLALLLTLISAFAFVAQDPVPPSRPGTLQQSTPAASPSPTPVPLPPPSIKVDNYRSQAGRIIGAALTSNHGWTRLAHLTDHIGNCLSGSKALERAIEWAIAEMKRDGLDNVRAEKVMVPHWVRGNESLEMISPVSSNLTMLGLGNSVGTPPAGITAEAIVVRNFDELEALGERVRGKIVVYNVPFTNYGVTVRYRGSGASRAARYGAVAVL